MFIMWSTKDDEAVLMHPVVSSVSLGIQLTVDVLIGQELTLLSRYHMGALGSFVKN